MLELDVVADTELLDESAVLFDVAILDVLQHAAALTDEHHETTTGVVVLLVGLEMLGEVADALGQDSDLNLCAAGIALALAELLDELCGALFADAELGSHNAPPFLRNNSTLHGRCAPFCEYTRSCDAMQVVRGSEAAGKNATFAV